MKLSKSFLYFIVPVLALAWPFISFLSNNYYQLITVEVRALWYSLGILSALSLVLTLIGRIFLKKEIALTRLAIIQIIFSIGVMQYGILRDFFLNNIYSSNSASLLYVGKVSFLHFVFWLVLLIVLSAMSWKFSAVKIYKFLSTVIMLMFLVPGLMLSYKVIGSLSAKKMVAVPEGKDEELMESPISRRLNVYYIILDSYPGQNTLRRVFDYDNSPFLSFLRQKKYYIADRAFTNYPLTHISLPASLNMEYPDTTGEREPFMRKTMEIMQGYNRFVKALKRGGYEYLHFENGYYGLSTCGLAADDCLPIRVEHAFWSKIIGTPQLLDTFYSSSIFYNYIGLKAFMVSRVEYRAKNNGIKELYSWFTEHFDSKLNPFFLFAHLLAPHEPWRYNSDCSPFIDLLESSGNKLTNKAVGTPEYKDKYLNEVKCLNKDVEKLVESIEKKDPNAIVVIQSDHGPQTADQFSRPFEKWTDLEILERFAILSAFKLPEECQSSLYRNISPVNNLRVVLGCLEKKNPKLLEDLSYFATYEDGKFIETIKKIKKMPEIE